MEVLEQTRPENQAMTFDEVSMECSKSFIQALRVILKSCVFICINFGS